MLSVEWYFSSIYNILFQRQTLFQIFLSLEIIHKRDTNNAVTALTNDRSRWNWPNFAMTCSVFDGLSAKAPLFYFFGSRWHGGSCMWLAGLEKTSWERKEDKSIARSRGSPFWKHWVPIWGDTRTRTPNVIDHLEL